MKDILDEGSVKTEELEVGHLNEMRKWTMFLSVTGLVFVAIFMLIGAVISFVPSMATYAGGSTLAYGFGGFLSILVMCGISALPLIFLLKFSSKTKTAITNQDFQELNNGLKNLKLYFRTIGIISLTTIGIYLLVILGLVVVSMFA